MTGGELSTRAAALALCLIVLTAFGPAGDAVTAEVTGLPGVGILVATIDDGKTEVNSYGAQFGGNSAFEIGSITKTFTAALFAEMIRRGEVAPSDPIERYLPPGATAPTYSGRHITLADLATQSSGLPRMPTNFTPKSDADPYADYDASRMYAFLSSYALQRAPGSTFEYSNYGFALLGELLARRLNMSYAEAIRTRILLPLGMTHTVVATVGSTIQTVGGHDVDGDPVANWTQGAFEGAGAIISTANDMLLYAKANLPGATGEVADAMRDARSPKSNAPGGPTIGYAWLTNPDGVIWHNGGTAGFRSFIGLDEMHDRAILIVANADLNDVDALGFHALDPTAPLPPAPVQDTAVNAATLDSYVGRYHFSDGSTMEVSHDARGLEAFFNPPGLHARLHARASDDFAILSPHVDVKFVGHGAATSAIVTQAGHPSDTGTRVSDTHVP
jgi:serine-type D-Ala-D-Ala carboxypeptidase/endopeptidase